MKNTHQIEQDGKTYFLEWDKDKGHIAITECIPEPTPEDLWEYMQELTEEELKGLKLSELLSDSMQDVDMLETYDYTQEGI